MNFRRTQRKFVSFERFNKQNCKMSSNPCSVPGCLRGRRKRNAKNKRVQSQPVFSIKRPEFARNQKERNHRQNLTDCILKLRDANDPKENILARLRRECAGICAIHFKEEDLFHHGTKTTLRRGATPIYHLKSNISHQERTDEKDVVVKTEDDSSPSEMIVFPSTEQSIDHQQQEDDETTDDSPVEAPAGVSCIFFRNKTYEVAMNLSDFCYKAYSTITHGEPLVDDFEDKFAGLMSKVETIQDLKRCGNIKCNVEDSQEAATTGMLQPEDENDNESDVEYSDCGMSMQDDERDAEYIDERDAEYVDECDSEYESNVEPDKIDQTSTIVEMKNEELENTPKHTNNEENNAIVPSNNTKIIVNVIQSPVVEVAEQRPYMSIPLNNIVFRPEKEVIGVQNQSPSAPTSSINSIQIANNDDSPITMTTITNIGAGVIDKPTRDAMLASYMERMKQRMHKKVEQKAEREKWLADYAAEKAKYDKYKTLNECGWTVWSCDQCAAQLKSWRGLEKHLKNHALASEDDGKCICEQCGKDFKQKRMLYQHKRNVHSQEDIVCDVCGSKFTNPKGLKKHKQSVIACALPAFKCKVCNEMFKDEETVSAHITQTHDSVLCDECGGNVTTCIHHQIEITKPYKCHRCDETFTYQHDIREHLLRRFCKVLKEMPTKKQRYLSEGRAYKTYPPTLKSGAYKHTCERCDMKFVTTVSYNTHVALLENCSFPAYECKMCLQKYFKEDSFNTHFQHDGHFDEECDVCSRTFNNNCIENRHQLNILKPYVCQHCAMKFSFRVNFVTHLRDCENKHDKQTLTRPKRFERNCAKTCEFCLKNFSNVMALTRHMRTHTGEKTYICEYCCRMFGQENSLKAHIRTHTGEKPYECDLCGKKYSDNRGLQKHIVKCVERNNSPTA